MSQDINERCARAMGGWPPHNWQETWGGETCSQCGKEKWQDPPEYCAGWSPSTDPNAARLLEDEIARRGLQEQYVHALQGLVASRDHWEYIRATPEQRARAFLAVMEPS